MSMWGSLPQGCRCPLTSAEGSHLSEAEQRRRDCEPVREQLFYATESTFPHVAVVADAVDDEYLWVWLPGCLKGPVCAEVAMD